MDHPGSDAQALMVEQGITSAELQVKVYADGADLAGCRELYANPIIKGFTTNPTLMRKAGITDYATFAKDLLAVVPDRPISFEVFSDDAREMERQGQLIAGWGTNVYVKIPVTDTRGQHTDDVLRTLAGDGVKLNVTGLMTLQQVAWTVDCLAGGPPAYISVFAGRIADTGVDPLPVMSAALEIMSPYPELELIWASPREILNVVQADRVGVHIITVTHDLLKKLPLLGKDPRKFSLETVRMFHDDALAAGYVL